MRRVLAGLVAGAGGEHSTAVSVACSVLGSALRSSHANLMCGEQERGRQASQSPPSPARVGGPQHCNILIQEQIFITTDLLLI